MNGDAFVVVAIMLSNEKLWQVLNMVMISSIKPLPFDVSFRQVCHRYSNLKIRFIYFVGCSSSAASRSGVTYNNFQTGLH